MANKYLDSNGLLYLWQKITGKFVAKETGKGLSTNDYTTDEKTKLAGLENYTLPTASGDTKGGVKVGSGLTMTGEVLSVSAHTHAISEVTGLETELSNKVNTSVLGQANGVAQLDANGKVPSTQLPSYVDDVVEGYFYNEKFYKEEAHTTEIIYVDLAKNKTYRYGGTTYVEISSSDMVAITNAEIDTVVAS